VALVEPADEGLRGLAQPFDVGRIDLAEGIDGGLQLLDIGAGVVEELDQPFDQVHRSPQFSLS
jgi:hypothetical protein